MEAGRDQLLSELRARFAELCVESRGHAHAEAYCLMRYRDEVTGEVEVLWNSRDGVTPFGIESRTGNEALHTDFFADRRVPDYKPPIGSRIFVDMTPEAALELAERFVEHWWNHAEHPLRDHYESRDAAVRARAFGCFEHGLAPDVVEVTAAMARERGWISDVRRSPRFG